MMRHFLSEMKTLIRERESLLDFLERGLERNNLVGSQLQTTIKDEYDHFINNLNPEIRDEVRRRHGEGNTILKALDAMLLINQAKLNALAEVQEERMTRTLNHKIEARQNIPPIHVSPTPVNVASPTLNIPPPVVNVAPPDLSELTREISKMAAHVTQINIKGEVNTQLQQHNQQIIQHVPFASEELLLQIKAMYEKIEEMLKFMYAERGKERENTKKELLALLEESQRKIIAHCLIGSHM